MVQGCSLDPKLEQVDQHVCLSRRHAAMTPAELKLVAAALRKRLSLAAAGTADRQKHQQAVPLHTAKGDVCALVDFGGPSPSRAMAAHRCRKVGSALCACCQLTEWCSLWVAAAVRSHIVLPTCTPTLHTGVKLHTARLTLSRLGLLASTASISCLASCSGIRS